MYLSSSLKCNWRRVLEHSSDVSTILKTVNLFPGLTRQWFQHHCTLQLSCCGFTHLFSNSPATIGGMLNALSVVSCWYAVKMPNLRYCFESSLEGAWFLHCLCRWSPYLAWEVPSHILHTQEHIVFSVLWFFMGLFSSECRSPWVDRGGTKASTGRSLAGTCRFPFPHFAIADLHLPSKCMLCFLVHTTPHTCMGVCKQKMELA